MKKVTHFLAAALCLALLLTGCGGKAPQTQPQTTAAPETTQAAVDAKALYGEVKAAAEALTDRKLRITREKQVSVGGETLEETAHQELTILGMGRDNPKALLTEAVSYGTGYETTFETVWAEGKVSLLVDGEMRFWDEAGPDWLDSLTPAVLMEESRYADITLEEAGGKTTFAFLDATEGEPWAMPEGAELLEADGEAVAEAGILTESRYHARYRYGSTEVEQTITVSLSPEAGEILVPELEEAEKVEDLEAVRLSEQVCGYLLQAKKVSSTLTEVVTAQAAGAVVTQTTAVDYHRVGDLMADVNNTVLWLDASTGETSSYTQKESLRKGLYTYSEDGGEPQMDGSVTPAVVRQYCENMFLGDLVSLEYWEDAKVEQLGDLIYVTCDFTQELAQALRENISLTLYNDPAYLDSYTQESTTTALTGYFSLDRYTALPVAAGYAYVSSDVVEGQTFAVALQSDQSFRSPDLGVYQTLTGKMEEEPQPENPATPLLYKVTGPEGQQMWLMGTIHIGDERTAYLPQSVYTAFDAADVLAVEVDIQAFEEAMLTDPNLQAQVLRSYCYLDGSTIVDHADLELLEKAEKFMKASGNFNANLLVMKPALWANTLENFYLGQGYDLMPEKGLDNRLLTRAKEQGKPIWNIESGEAQMAMLGGWSDGLQELLLENALGYGPCEYWQEAARLYEQWCLGDEQALRALLNEEVQEGGLTEQEQALYGEYTDAMITQRNEAMLETALEYLNSGDTVFYAVGLAHLLQGNGLVDGLRAAGCTVEQVG